MSSQQSLVSQQLWSQQHPPMVTQVSRVQQWVSPDETQPAGIQHSHALSKVLYLYVLAWPLENMHAGQAPKWSAFCWDQVCLSRQWDGYPSSLGLVVEDKHDFKCIFDVTVLLETRGNQFTPSYLSYQFRFCIQHSYYSLVLDLPFGMGVCAVLTSGSRLDTKMAYANKSPMIFMMVANSFC